MIEEENNLDNSENVINEWLKLEKQENEMK